MDRAPEASLEPIMRILIVEDSPQTRKLLLFLLQERFIKEAKFREAQDLKTAFHYLKMWHDADRQAKLDGQPVDSICIILDLSLPDSAGKETFHRIYKAYPEIPIVVMTNTNDRELAEAMVDHGAQDYILKNFTDEEEIFRRVSFAVRRHRRTITMPPMDAASVHRLDSSRAQLHQAHDSGQHKAVRERSMEVLDGMSDVVKRTFVGIQDLTIKFEKSETVQEHMADDMKSLSEEVRGSHGRRSMRSEIEILSHRFTSIETDFVALNSRIDKTEKTVSETKKEDRVVAVQLDTNRMDNRTKVIIAVLGLLGMLITAYMAYKFGVKI